MVCVNHNREPVPAARTRQTALGHDEMTRSMGKKIRRLSRPLNFYDGDDFAALDEAATTRSPRAAAIVATALVEDALRWCLCGFLIPADADQAELPAVDQAELFDNENGPLRTFHAKIVMGYSLGIYGQVTRDDLRRMQLIRNAFAHSPRSISGFLILNTQGVSEKCPNLFVEGPAFPLPTSNPQERPLRLAGPTPAPVIFQNADSPPDRARNTKY